MELLHLQVGKWTNTLETKECPRVQAWIKAMKEHPLVTTIMENSSDDKYLESYSASLSKKIES